MNFGKPARIAKILGLSVGSAASLVVFNILSRIAEKGMVVLYETNCFILVIEQYFAVVGVCVCALLALKEILCMIEDFEDRRCNR